MTGHVHAPIRIELVPAVPLPFAPADLARPPLVCMVDGMLVENTVAGMEAHRRFHRTLEQRGIA